MWDVVFLLFVFHLIRRFTFVLFVVFLLAERSNLRIVFLGRSIIVKKGDGSQVKESTDSSTTLEDDDIKGKR